MLSVPRAVERRASGVGTQVWKYDENARRKGVVGVQCSGRLPAKTECKRDIVSQTYGGVTRLHDLGRWMGGRAVV